MNRTATGKVGIIENEHFWSMENLQEIQRLPSISPLNLNYFGSEQCESGYFFGPYTRTSYVLHFVRSGRGTLMKQGVSYPVESGQAFLLYPGEETVYQADKDDPWYYSWVGFHGLQAEEMMERAGFTPQEPVRTCKNMDMLTETLDALLAASELTYVNELLRMGYFYQLIGLLTLNNEEPLSGRDHTGDTDSMYVRMAVSIMINPHNPQIKVSDVARAIGISRGYLTSIFKREMKLSPQEFQKNFRMEKAGDILRSTDSPVSVVAAELGYADVLSFSKSFRHHFGMSPTVFRQQNIVIIRENEKGKYISDHPL